MEYYSESKTGELFNKLIDMGVLERREDPEHKRYFLYRVDYIYIAEQMSEYGESFFLPRVYDDENINLSLFLSAPRRVQEEPAVVEVVEQDTDSAEEDSSRLEEDYNYSSETVFNELEEDKYASGSEHIFS